MKCCVCGKETEIGELYSLPAMVNGLNLVACSDNCRKKWRAMVVNNEWWWVVNNEVKHCVFVNLQNREVTVRLDDGQELVASVYDLYLSESAAKDEMTYRMVVKQNAPD